MMQRFCRRIASFFWPNSAAAAAAAAQAEKARLERAEADRARTAVDARLGRANQVAQAARTVWLGLLGFLAFVTLTLLSVRDIDFFSLEAAISLPLVNIAVPTTVFFWSAAWLTAVFHAFLQIHLLKLWDPLAELPATWQERPVAEALHPWIVTDWALRLRPDGDRVTVRRPLARLADMVAPAAVWLASPAVVAAFWWRSMPAHDEGLTIAIAAALWLALYVSLRNWRRARSLLRRIGEAQPEAEYRRVRRGLALAAMGVLLVVVSWVRTEGGFDHYAMRAIDAWERAMGPTFKDDAEDPGPEMTARERWVRAHFLTLDDLTLRVENPGQMLRWLALIGVVGIERDARGDVDVATWSPFAPIDLVGADLVGRPADWVDHDIAQRRFRVGWCRDQAIPPEACHAPVENDYVDRAGQLAEVASAQARADFLTARALWCEAPDVGRALGVAACASRFAALDRIVLSEWRAQREGVLGRLLKPDMAGRDLRRAQASGAFMAGLDLRGARLEGANLVGARLEGVDLRGARLERANLSGAWLEGADLGRAQLNDARLDGAHLEGSSLIEARLEYASLEGARLKGADLSGGRMRGAYFAWGWLEGADLSRARLDGADFRWARMEGADLSEAWLENATLTGTRLEGVDLSGAQLDGADLTAARLEGTVLLKASVGATVWTGATLGLVWLGEVDLSTASGLEQTQLDDAPAGPAIGDADTILPRDALTEEQLVVWSCWDSLPPGVARIFSRLGLSESDAMGWVCDGDNPRIRTGRPAKPAP